MTLLYHLHAQAQRNVVAVLATMRRRRWRMYSDRLSLM